MPETPTLSKSRYMAGWQCPLKLWYECFCPDLAQPADEASLARRQEGDEVGALARQRFPGALVTAGWDRPSEAREETRRLMADPSVNAIHEAAFEFEGATARVDILRRNDDGTWDLIEVKSVGEAEDVHRRDASFQRWLLGKAGIPMSRTWLMVLNKAYRYQGGALDLTQLFRMIDLSACAERVAPGIEQEVVRFRAVLGASDGPKVSPSSHCYEPYECAYLQHCTAHWPKVDHPVEWLPSYGGKTSMKAHQAGTHSMMDLPPERLNALQRRVLDCYKAQSPWVGSGLAKALEAFTFPIHFLDFETVSSAIPRLVGSGPYEAIPFQWSCHTLDEQGRLTHHEYLVDDTSYPREKLFTALLDVLGEAGSICVYYAAFERGKFKDAIREHPHLAERLQPAIDRIVDLNPIVKEHVYHPAFYGSFSIKWVLPALVPELSYKELAVQDGMAAVRGFLDMLGTTDPEAREAKRKDLLDYCGLDTLAMVKVREALIRLAQTH